MNSPVNFNDPTGHVCSDPEDPTPSCDGSGGYPSNIPHPNPPAPNNGGGNGGGDDDLDDELGLDDCTYHLCSDANLYEIGWENFGQAWDIWTNPNATYSQQFLAGAYISYWGGAHLAFIAGAIVLVWEAVVPGSMSCITNPDCQQRVFWSGGEVARKAAETWAKANNAATIEMTRAGQNLLQIEKLRGYNAARPFWETASAEFASGASGKVHVFLSSSVNYEHGVWATIEYPLLLVNDAVTTIIPHIVGP